MFVPRNIKSNNETKKCTKILLKAHYFCIQVYKCSLFIIEGLMRKRDYNACIIDSLLFTLKHWFRSNCITVSLLFYNAPSQLRYFLYHGTNVSLSCL
jgi:hypothetical protein